MLNYADLPNDIDVLRALLLVAEQTVRERDAAIAARDEVVPGLRTQPTKTEVEIEHRH
jgi:transposase